MGVLRTALEVIIKKQMLPDLTINLQKRTHTDFSRLVFSERNDRACGFESVFCVPEQ